jgi:hypothetical protein
MEQEPWQYYFDAFAARAARVPQEAFGRSELLFEAAHDAYENTTNHLTGSGWNEEQALTVTRLFGQVVKEWLAKGGDSMDGLRDQLRSHYSDWIR